MNANERIVSLVAPKHLERIPSFLRQHSTVCLCRIIAKDYPALYSAFSQETEPSAEEKAQMSAIVNQIFERRIKKRCHKGDTK